ncbi:hypothetical protein [Verminephrobacter aporrectodeae]
MSKFDMVSRSGLRVLGQPESAGGRRTGHSPGFYLGAWPGRWRATVGELAKLDNQIPLQAKIAGTLMTDTTGEILTLEDVAVYP